MVAAPWLTVQATKITVAVIHQAVNTKMTVTVISVAVIAHMRYITVMITHIQIRAARALLGWKQIDLAKAADLSEMSVKNIERGNTDPRVSTITAMRAALESAGVQFVEPGVDPLGPGVALRLPTRPAATEAQMQASADDVRSQAADAADEAMSEMDATDQQKAERRGALTDEPAVIGRARGKGRGKP